MRVKSISARRHRKVLKQAKGFRQARSNRFQVAQEAVVHAGAYAFAGRKLKKRDLRSLWIARINAGVTTLGISYSKFIAGLKKANIEVDRKIMSEIATKDIATFKEIVKAAGFSFTSEK
ncbi:MAG TPA: 50S ribosomal protein L20 [Alphaproteobacteria bacterium]|jgi:large subunit ribosomal protein L20|nr:50S ribosomal protein L20 [Alphaproteobacteria bacterium]